MVVDFSRGLAWDLTVLNRICHWHIGGKVNSKYATEKKSNSRGKA